MASSSSKPRRQASSQTTSSSSRGSRTRRSEDSYGSRSTAPTSVYSSPRPSDLKKMAGSTSSAGSSNYTYSTNSRDVADYEYCEEEISPGSSLYPRSSVDTYASTTASEEELCRMEEADGMDYEYSSIPPLPVYRREVVEPNVRASSPQDFAKLFPSLHRFTIRHDEFTPDGNMNLRVDTVLSGRRRSAIQLFHLRMYDLTKREFSLRRYCRDSGREVCNSKREYVKAPSAKEPKPAKTKTRSWSSSKNGPEAGGRPSLQRSMSTALRSLGRRGSFGSNKRPGTSSSSSTSDGDDESSRASLDSRASATDSKKGPTATNSIKLEFSNYARVDVHRRGGGKNHKRYDFDWWGHRYSWRRSVDKQLGLVSFHLVRDGYGNAPVAHIVPETRSPSQVYVDENAGGWVPPCFMWIADQKVVDAVTDVADVIMATGLIALVDDCIKDRWETNKPHRIPLPLTAKSVSIGNVSPKTVMRHVFGRRHSDHQPSSPLRYAMPISAY